MVTRNDYHLRLFNGDIGIIFNDIQSENRPRFFHQYADGTIKKILPLKLPEHETVYAMTVHKSQGSEFDNVLLILPERTSPVLTRELLYTAITRARKNVKILGDENIMRQMINMPTVRISGLRDALWGEPCS
jgi:exodeoxyribonuclease V alpha subunit